VLGFCFEFSPYWDYLTWNLLLFVSVRTWPGSIRLRSWCQPSDIWSILGWEYGFTGTVSDFMPSIMHNEISTYGCPTWKIVPHKFEQLTAHLFTPESFCSGDFDSIFSLTVTRYSVQDLNLAVTRKWRPWYTPNGEVKNLHRQNIVEIVQIHVQFGRFWLERWWVQVGGYVQQYQGGFTLASVRAAGHMVPASQPERSLVLLYAFLKNMLPPANIPDWSKNWAFTFLICELSIHILPCHLWLQTRSLSKSFWSQSSV
jgi:hypothetical protein